MPAFEDVGFEFSQPVFSQSDPLKSVYLPEAEEVMAPKIPEHESERTRSFKRATAIMNIGKRQREPQIKMAMERDDLVSYEPSALSVTKIPEVQSRIDKIRQAHEKFKAITSKELSKVYFGKSQNVSAWEKLSAILKEDKGSTLKLLSEEELSLIEDLQEYVESVVGDSYSASIEHGKMSDDCETIFDGRTRMDWVDPVLWYKEHDVKAFKGRLSPTTEEESFTLHGVDKEECIQRFAKQSISNSLDNMDPLTEELLLGKKASRSKSRGFRY